jgi:hypothetical protein
VSAELETLAETLEDKLPVQYEVVRYESGLTVINHDTDTLFRVTEEER